MRNFRFSRYLQILFLIFTAMSFVSQRANARRISRWYGPRFNYSHWRGGYWYHGAWGPRVGWWWVVGPTWYYYPAPIYPYPSPDVQPGYFAEVGSAPPPMALTAPPPTGAPPTAMPIAPASSAKSQAFSYYCKATNSYYPIASACEGGWIASPVKGPN